VDSSASAFQDVQGGDVGEGAGDFAADVASSFDNVIVQ